MGITRILRDKGRKKWMMVAFMALWLVTTTSAQTNSDHVSVGVGALYERGLDLTISYEHETKYHNAWEYFANGYRWVL